MQVDASNASTSRSGHSWAASRREISASICNRHQHAARAD
jgi:hypothetical protein